MTDLRKQAAGQRLDQQQAAAAARGGGLAPEPPRSFPWSAGTNGHIVCAVYYASDATNALQASVRFALAAKEAVLRAQDCIGAANLPPTATGRSASAGRRRAAALHARIARELARARRIFEDIDTAYNEYGIREQQAASNGERP